MAPFPVIAGRPDDTISRPGLGTRIGSARLGLWTVLGLALALRVASALQVSGAHHPDETFQAFEQAHRYAFGYGLTPWEFDVGLRSTLLPALLSLLFRVGDAVLGAPAGTVGLGRVALAVLSLLPVAAIYRAGLRRSPVHAALGGVAAATWCELVSFSHRPLTEAVAADFLLAGLALVTFRGPELPRRVLVGLGACLALALALRIQFAPAVAVIGLATSPWRHPGRLLVLALGSAGPLAAFGLADWIAWGAPFHAPVTSLLINVGQDVASGYGTSPAAAYLGAIAGLIGPLAPLLIVPLVLGARSYRTWIVTAAVIVLSHSAIPHKEYRFIFAATSILWVAAGFGAADLLVLRPAYARAGQAGRAGLAALVAAVWAGGSLVAASGEQQRGHRDPYGPQAEAFRVLARQPDLCGLGLQDVHWSLTPGYAGLHRDVPIYQGRPADPLSAAGGYNYVLAPIGAARPEAGYDIVQCFTHPARPGVCLLRRPGSCGSGEARPPLARGSTPGEPPT